MSGLPVFLYSAFTDFLKCVLMPIVLTRKLRLLPKPTERVLSEGGAGQVCLTPEMRLRPGQSAALSHCPGLHVPGPCPAPGLGAATSGHALEAGRARTGLRCSRCVWRAVGVRVCACTCMCVHVKGGEHAGGGIGSPTGEQKKGRKS